MANLSLIYIQLLVFKSHKLTTLYKLEFLLVFGLTNSEFSINFSLYSFDTKLRSKISFTGKGVEARKTKETNYKFNFLNATSYDILLQI